jgi:hypothetical protein
MRMADEKGWLEPEAGAAAVGESMMAYVLADHAVRHRGQAGGV